MSSKQRRGFDPEATWRQNKAAENAKQYNGQLRDYEVRREALATVTSQVFDKIEVHLKGFESCVEVGIDGEWQKLAASSAAELLRAWHALRELPKNVRKPYEVIDEQLESYLQQLGKFADLEPEAAKQFIFSIKPYYKYSSLDERRKLRTDSIGFLSADAGLLRIFWKLFYDVKYLIPKLD